jgi:AraC-like DNA-binding protein
MNLARFSAEWIPADARIAPVVDTYWAVQWNLPPGAGTVQRIIDFPAVTLSIEAGDVPAPFVISVVRPGAWERTIDGHGDVFAIRLRPAGLPVLSNLDAMSLSPEQEITPRLDARLHQVLSAIARGNGASERARLADDVLSAALQERPLTARQKLANDAVDLLAGAPVSSAGETVAAALGCHVRTLQRVLRETTGCSPSEIARRLRLQEVVRRLSVDSADAATVAGELGYVDQAHMIRDFRSSTGITPGRYLRDAAASASANATSAPPS